MFLIRYLWLCQFFPVLCYYEQYQNEHTHKHISTHKHTPLLFASIWDLYLYALITQSCLTHCHPMDCYLPLSMRFFRENTGVGCHSLLQRIFPTWGSNLGFLFCRQILYHLSHQGRLHLWKGNYYSKGLVFLNIERYWQIPLQWVALTCHLPNSMSGLHLTLVNLIPSLMTCRLFLKSIG